MISDIVLQTIMPVVTLFLTVLVLSYYIQRSRELNSRIKEASEIIESVVVEIRNRMKVQEKKIMDQEVEIDILELKLSNVMDSSLNKVTKEVGGVDIQEKSRLQSVRSLMREEENGKENFTDTEERMLGYLSQREYTAMELQSVIRKTREHTSRILKKLFKDGYIERNESKRPFVYFVTKKDKSISA